MLHFGKGLLPKVGSGNAGYENNRLNIGSLFAATWEVASVAIRLGRRNRPRTNSKLSFPVSLGRIVAAQIEAKSHSGDRQFPRKFNRCCIGSPALPLLRLTRPVSFVDSGGAPKGIT